MLRRSFTWFRTSFSLDTDLSKSLTRLIYHEHHRPRSAEEEEHIQHGSLNELRGKFFQKPRFRDPDRQKRELQDQAGGAAAAAIKGGGNTYNVAEAVYESKMELRWIVEHVNGLDLPDQSAFDKEVQRAVLERVDEHKPLAYILGTQPFVGCDIICKEPLLIPRTETEEWVLWLIQQYLNPVDEFNYPDGPTAQERKRRPFQRANDDEEEPNYFYRRPGAPLTKMRVLDLCCGTGCIGAALLRKFDWIEVVGVDSDQRACELAFENYYSAARLGVRHRVMREEQEAADARRKERERLKALQAQDQERFFEESELDDVDGGEDEEEITSSLPKEERIMNRLRRQAEAFEAKVDKEHEKTNQGRISVLQSDMFRDLPPELMNRSDGRGEGFDIILSNPPYLMPEEWELTEESVKRFESRKALVGDQRHEKQPLSYFKELRDESPKWLCDKTPEVYLGPRLMFEVGIQARYMQQFFAEHKKWKSTVVHCDRFDKPRWVETGFVVADAPTPKRSLLA